MVVAQLVEWLLPTPEVLSSNPVICTLYAVNCIDKMKIKTKRPGIVHYNFFNDMPFHNRHNSFLHLMGLNGERDS